MSLSHCGRFYQHSAKMFLSVTSPKIPPCARSLCNYRCKLGVCGRLPGFIPPLPVNNTLPTTFHCVSSFCDLMPVSCGVKRVNVLLKVTVLSKLLRLNYIINPQRRGKSCAEAGNPGFNLKCSYFYPILCLYLLACRTIQTLVARNASF